MKKRIVALSCVGSLCACALLLAGLSSQTTSLRALDPLVRHEITIDHTNRKNVRWNHAGEEYVCRFDIVGETELGNPYSSEECYLSVYDPALVDVSSDEYICRMSMEKGHDYKCWLVLGFDARSDERIKVGMIEHTSHASAVTLDVVYNDDGVHMDLPLSMNHDLGYASDAIALQGDILSITLYSVSIAYSCSY